MFLLIFWHILTYFQHILSSFPLCKLYSKVCFFENKIILKNLLFLLKSASGRKKSDTFSYNYFFAFISLRWRLWKNIHFVYNIVIHGIFLNIHFLTFFKKISEVLRFDFVVLFFSFKNFEFWYPYCPSFIEHIYFAILSDF